MCIYMISYSCKVVFIRICLHAQQYNCYHNCLHNYSCTCNLEIVHCTQNLKIAYYGCVTIVRILKIAQLYCTISRLERNHGILRMHNAISRSANSQIAQDIYIHNQLTSVGLAHTHPNSLVEPLSVPSFNSV